MFSRFLIGFFTVLSLIPAVTASVSRDTVTVLKSLKTSIPPTIDGHLDEMSWDRALSYSDFVLYRKKGYPAQTQTKALLLYDNSHLYIAFECDEPLIEKMVSSSKSRDESVWNDDCVEVVLPVEKHGQDFWHIIVNSAGVVYDAFNSNSAKNISNLQVATTIGHHKWLVEMAIPFQSLYGRTPDLGDSWAVKFARERKAGIDPVISCYPYQSDSFSSIGDVGMLLYAEEIIKQPTILAKIIESGERSFGVNTLVTQLTNTDDRGHDLSIKVWTTDTNDHTQYENQVSVRLASQSTEEFTLNYTLASVKECSINFAVENTFGQVVFFMKYPTVFAGEIDSVMAALSAVNLAQISLPFFDEDSLAKGRIQSELQSVLTCQTDFNRELSLSIDTSQSFDSQPWVAYKKSLSQFLAWVQGNSYLITTTDNIWRDLSPRELAGDFGQKPLISISAARQEYESAAFDISNVLAGPTLDVRMIISDLEGPNGSVISSADIDLREVVFVRGTDDRLLGDALLGNATHRAQVPLGQSRQMWLTFHVRDKAPGLYKGHITVKPTDLIDPLLAWKTIAIELVVWDFSLPETLPIDVGLFDSIKTPPYAIDFPGFLLDQKEHRMNMAFYRDFKLPSPDGEYFRLAKELQMRLFLITVAKSPEKVKAAREYFESIGYDIDKIVFQVAPDEPKIQYFHDHGEELFELVKNIRAEQPDIFTLIDIVGNRKNPDAPFVKEISPYIDSWCPTLRHWYPLNLDEPEIQMYLSGKERWSYECRFPMDMLDIQDYYRLTPWKVYKVKLDAFFYWTYCCFNGDPWDHYGKRIKSSLGSFNGLVYPSQHNQEIVASRRWEMIRESWDDYLYLDLLEKKISAAQKDGFDVQSSQNLLDESLKTVLKNPTNENFYQVRKKMAEEIIRLGMIKP